MIGVQFSSSAGSLSFSSRTFLLKSSSLPFSSFSPYKNLKFDIFACCCSHLGAQLIRRIISFFYYLWSCFCAFFASPPTLPSSHFLYANLRRKGKRDKLIQTTSPLNSGETCRSISFSFHLTHSADHSSSRARSLAIHRSIDFPPRNGRINFRFFRRLLPTAAAFLPVDAHISNTRPQANDTLAMQCAYTVRFTKSLSDFCILSLISISK